VFLAWQISISLAASRASSEMQLTVNTYYPPGAFEFVGDVLRQACRPVFGCVPHVDPLGDHDLNSPM
jgi:hypothetical protein